MKTRFCLLAILLVWSKSFAADVREYVVAKGAQFYQSTAAAPDPVSGDDFPFQFFVSVHPTVSNSVTSASVHTPGGSTLPLTSGGGDSEIRFRVGFVTQTALDSAYPAGTYQFTINTSTQGTKTPSLTLTADAFPTAPHCANYDAAQIIDATGNFLLTWDVFSGAGPEDSIYFQIHDNNATNGNNIVVETNLDASATSFLIPAGALQPGSVYETRIEFINGVSMNTNAYPGAQGLVGFFAQTKFQIAAANPAGTFQFLATSYSVNENAGSVNIPVRRSGGSVGTATIDFSVNPTSSRYVQTNGTLVFGDGVTNQVITVQIVDDAVTNGYTAFQVSLSNPMGGATLANQNNTSVTIVDDEAPAGPDVIGFIVGKGQQYRQTNSSAATLDSDSPYQFGSFVRLAFPEAATNASLHSPSSGNVSLMAKDDPSSARLEYAQEFSTKSALDAAFGAGNYTLTIGTINDGIQQATLAFGTDSYPNAPHISNFAAAQSIDPGLGFQLNWDAMTGGTTNDFIQVSITRQSTNNDEEVFHTPDFPDAGYLDGTATSLIVPAGVLLPNQSYKGELLFARRAATSTNYPGVIGVSAYFKDLKFPLATMEATPVQGRIGFTSGSFTVAENSSNAVVTIVRNGGTTGAVTVDFTTANGSATAGADYDAVSTTVTFLDGETNKTVNIPIFDDVLLEGNETVLLALSNPLGGAVLGTANATLTISDNETATSGALQFSAATYTVNESAGTATITVNRTGGTAGSVSVAYSTSNGTATAGQDYTATSGTLTFPAGVASKTFTVPISNDGVNEPNETVNLTLSNPTGGAALGTRNTAVLTIVDNDPLAILQFSSTNYSVAENSKSVAVTVTRTGGKSAVNVNFATANGTATAGADYRGTNGTLFFGSGVLSRSFTVPILGDTQVEGNETILLWLQNPTGLGALGTRSNATITILDNDFGGVLNFSATNYNVSETSVLATITVIRSNGLAGNVTVNYATVAGSATPEVDYTNVSGLLTFGTNETKKTFTIPIKDDSSPEGNETVNLVLSNPTGGASLGKISNSTLTIIDSEATLQFLSTNYSVAENGTSAKITVARTGTGAGTVSVSYAATDGTAVAGSDYTAKNGTLTFASGAMSQSFTIPVANDTLADGDKTVNLSLFNPVGIALGQQSNAVLTIVDDDKAGVLNFTSPTYTVSETGKVVTITVVRTNGTASGVSVNFAAFNGTAIDGSDFVATNGTMTFAANETKKTFSVQILDDTTVEGPETVALALSNPQGNATLGSVSNAVLTITDNDVGTVLRFATNVYRVFETNGSARISVFRAGGLSSSVTVDYSTSDGTASAGGDYSPVSGTLQFGPNVTSNSFVVPIVSDSLHDPDETINLHLSNPSGVATLGTLSNATLVILEPKPVVSLSTTSAKLLVPGNCMQTFRISNVGPQGSTLDYLVADDGSLGGFLNVNNASGSVSAGSFVDVQVSVKDEFVNSVAGSTFVLNVYTPGAANFEKIPVSVPVVGQSAEAQNLLGSWSGTWSGFSYGRHNPGEAEPTAAVSGAWTLTLSSVDLDHNTAAGSLTWNGSDAYWTYVMDNGVITSATPHTFVPNRTINFSNANTTLTVPGPGSCGRYTLDVEGFQGAPNPSDAFYGPRFNVDLDAETGNVISVGVSWSAHPYNSDNMDTAVSSGSVTGHKN